MPAAFLFGTLPQKFDLKQFKKAFIIGVFVSGILALVSASFRAIQGQDWEQLVYFSFTEDIYAHPVYFSLFVVVSQVFLLDNRHGFSRLKFILLSIFFALFILLAQSKTGILLFGAIIIIDFTVHLFSRGKRVQALMASVVMISFFILLGGKSRVSEILNKPFSVEIGTQLEDGVHQRKWLWLKATGQWKDSPILGYGLGSQRNLFAWRVEKEILETKELSSSHIKAAKVISKLNLHNQYLQYLYEAGLLGIAVLFTAFGYQIWNASLVKFDASGKALLIFMIFLATENLLDRQMGIYFYALVLTCLMESKLSERSENA